VHVYCLIRIFADYMFTSTTDFYTTTQQNYSDNHTGHTQ
jgi:hypothetical protein